MFVGKAQHDRIKRAEARLSRPSVTLPVQSRLSKKLEVTYQIVKEQLRAQYSRPISDLDKARNQEVQPKILPHGNWLTIKSS